MCLEKNYAPPPARARLALRALLLMVAAATALPTAAAADQASQPTSPAAARIATGKYQTCAVLSGGTVRCWGYGGDGALGYGNTTSVGATQTPASVGPVNLGGGRTATAIAAGAYHTCALLDNGTVRCWGYGGDGRLGYGNTNSVGATQTPGSVGPVDLGPGRTAEAITAGGAHTCAILDDGSVRCWGDGAYGQLGYGNTMSVGATQTPGSVGPVDLGPGRTAIAISAGDLHTCALLDDRSVRCWGDGAYGRLGYCSERNVGDIQAPGSVGPVNLKFGDGGAGCAGGGSADPRHLEALRAQALRRCLARTARRPKLQRDRERSHCLNRYGRTPGRIKALKARAFSSTRVVLSFAAPGSDGNNPPAARAYLVKQSRQPIRGTRSFLAAQTLCNGYCRFKVALVGTMIDFTITHLAPRTTYYYAIAALDNVTARPGPRSGTIKVKTG